LIKNKIIKKSEMKKNKIKTKKNKIKKFCGSDDQAYKLIKAYVKNRENMIKEINK
jgi:hypothetical protein